MFRKYHDLPTFCTITDGSCGVCVLSRSYKKCEIFVLAGQNESMFSWQQFMIVIGSDTVVWQLCLVRNRSENITRGVEAFWFSLTKCGPPSRIGRIWAPSPLQGLATSGYSPSPPPKGGENCGYPPPPPPQHNDLFDWRILLFWIINIWQYLVVYCLARQQPVDKL